MRKITDNETRFTLAHEEGARFCRHNPAIIAHSLLRELSFWFEFTEDEMPYVQRDGDASRVAPELFVQRQ
jgi:hypothetical protein